MANSYNGWTAPPANLDPNFGKRVGAPPFGSGGFSGGLAAGDVSTVMAYLVSRLHNEVEPMMTDPNTGQLGYGCWGYSYRDNVNNPGQLSNHASGTAIDYNAPKHANGTSVGPNGGGGWTGKQYQQVQEILNGPLQGSVNWLTSNDPMHFDIRANSTKLAQVAQSLGGYSPLPSTDDWFDMATKDELAQVVAEQISAAVPAIAVAVWMQNITDTSANNLLAVASSYGPSLEQIRVMVEDQPVRVWTQSVTDEAANDLLARAAGPKPV
jgi:hypothetical protein